MPLHTRPIPAPARVPGGPNDPARPQVTLVLPPEDPPVAPTALPAAAAPVATPETATPVPEVAPAATVPSAMPWPWYRREPWVPVIFAAFVPLGAAFVLPQAFHLLLIAVSALLVVLSTAMLIRQGPFSAHPPPEPPRDAARRAEERRRAAA